MSHICLPGPPVTIHEVSQSCKSQSRIWHALCEILAHMTSMKITGSAIDLGDDLWAVSAWEVEFANLAGVAATVTMTVSFDFRLERFAIDAVNVERLPDGEDVTGATLRMIRIGELLQMTAPGHIWFADPTVSLNRADWGLSLFRDTKPISGRATANDVATAARIYRVASIAAMPPLKAVADTLHVSQSTATRLIATARSNGLVLTGLGPTFDASSRDRGVAGGAIPRENFDLVNGFLAEFVG